MSLYEEIEKKLSLEDRPIEELIEISSLVDEGKRDSESLNNSKSEASRIATEIIALSSSNDTADVGYRLYNHVNALIVSKNRKLADEKNGKDLYEKLLCKPNIGKYTIHRHNNGYSFALQTPSGEILAVSELYSKAETCMQGIEAVRRNTNGEVEDQTDESYSRLSHPKFEIYTGKDGVFHFRLKAKNGEILVNSEGYKNKQSCLRAIESVRQNAVSDTIEKA